MSTQSKPAPGKFVWFDLMTTDLEAALKFYPALLGWEIKTVDMGPMGPYNMALVGGRDIGGFMPMDEATKQAGAPSHWLGYTTVDDVDSTAGRAERMGGKVLHPAMDIPNIGRFAVLADPQGAVFSLFSYAGEHPEKEDAKGPGNFVWHELMTTDPKAATGFYGEIFGWTTEEHSMGDHGTYTFLKRQDKGVGGVIKLPPGMSQPAWMHYVGVEDVDATFAKVAALGGKQILPPQDIPQAGRFAIVADPTGAAFALWK
jgi:uncharacterized protein